MVNGIFESLLQELGTIIKVKLQPDKNSACVLKFKNGLEVQLEIASNSGYLQIATEIAQIPAGRYRENIFREALKANGLPPPQNGIFAYSKKNEALVLYDQLLFESLNGQKLHEYLTQFVQKADLWKKSIERAEIPSFIGNEFTFGEKKGSAFGLVR